MNRQIHRRRSGPRSFDRNEAIETAMRLFWRQGYEGTSLADLTGAIGIAPPSLYAAFGSKAGLYQEALDRYGTLDGALDGLTGAEDVDDAVEGILRSGVLAVSDSERERGCMVSSGMVQCALEHGELALDLARRRRLIREEIASALSRWLEPEAAWALAGHIAATLQGLSIHARDGASREELDRIADEAIAGVRSRKLGRT